MNSHKNHKTHDDTEAQAQLAVSIIVSFDCTRDQVQAKASVNHSDMLALREELWNKVKMES